MTNVAPYGSWRSPISPAMVAGSGVPLLAPQLAGEVVVWLEGRPMDGGRFVLVRRSPGGAVADVTPPGFDLRTRVHEYGGIPFAVFGHDVFYSNFGDQRLYRQPLAGGEPRPITAEPPEPASYRYADLDFTPDGSLIVCVRERHEGGEVVNELVALPSDGSRDPWILTGGNDFYSYPRVSPDGRRLAWTTWNHPNMPWDGTELWAAELSNQGELREPRKVAGGAEESIFQPAWSPGGVLHFVSDRDTGWWNLYRERDGVVEALTEADAEFGVPQWLFGISTYAFVDEDRIACAYSRGGRQHLAVHDASQGVTRDLDLPWTALGYTLHAKGERLLLVAASATEPAAVIDLDAGTGDWSVLRRSLEIDIDRGYLSAPRAIEFPTSDGAVAHALFYPPANPEFAGPPDERPPLIVFTHGGPTAQTLPQFSLSIQFWTSRGFAVADVNYRGSTGYGRAYRDALKPLWGVADTEDCVNVARHLAGQNEVDGSRMCIRGGSAGGYATLCAITFHDTFAAGASYYGVGDVEALVRDTHKFESRYIDRLVGPYPEAVDVYRERSPVHHIDRLNTPVILFQGLEDEVVPPNQAEAMAEALREKGIPFAYLAFEGEQHGFRKAETIEHSIQAELSFYAQVLGFEHPTDVDRLAVENL